jgi:hypothetical protein
MPKRSVRAAALPAALLWAAPAAFGMGVLLPVDETATLSSVTVTFTAQGATTYAMSGAIGPLVFTSAAAYDPATGQAKETLTQSNGNKIKSTAICTADPWLTAIGCTGGQVQAQGDFKPDVVNMIVNQMRAPVSAYLISGPDRDKIRAAYQRRLDEKQKIREGLRGGAKSSASTGVLFRPTPTHAPLVGGLKKSGGVNVSSAALQPTAVKPTTPAYPPYGAVYTGGTPPGTMKAGQVAIVPVTVQNTSSQTWPANGLFRLAFHWSRAGVRIVHDGDRTFLPSAVAPGATVNLNAKVTAPPTSGPAVLHWDMVHEGVAWFSDKGVPMSAPKNVNVTP